ncbi:hypothetical protein HAX54_009488 [Datura stramonium]|uniref:Uncharacterized protein n=1 Tax=Datura stramonium TaxID=4076 RepID=A0ABS8TEU3_DATST|nr:hypothetical protein [Datura stramonium]
MGLTRHLEARDDQYAWIAGIITKGQPLWVVIKGDIHRQDLKFEARMWLDLVTSMSFPVLISFLCLWVECLCFRSLDKMRRVEGIMDLATNIDTDAPAIERKKLDMGPSASPISEGSEDVHAPPLPSLPTSSTSSGLLKLAQMAHYHNARLVKLAKLIPFMN